MNVAILYGGKSGEHEVSLASASSIVKNIRHEHTVLLIGIDKDGQWYAQSESTLDRTRIEGNPLELVSDQKSIVVAIPGKGLALRNDPQALLEIDVIFPVLHGTFGEDGTIQGLLECVNIPYVGADVLGSAIGMDKETAKALWDREKLPVLPFFTVSKSELERRGVMALRTQIETRFEYPLFVKPVCAGSSVGTSKIAHADDFEQALKSALEWDTRALVEPCVNAREIECSVLGNETPRAFCPGEIVPSHEFYDYEAKYIDPDGAAFVIPADLSDVVRTRIKEIAIKAYKAARINGMARVDFFIDKKNDSIYLNELNTIPGFTSISMFPKMCVADGLPYSDLIENLMILALERKRKRDALRFAR